MYYRENFQDTLQELIVARNLTIKTLSEQSGVPLSPLYRFAKGESIPSHENAAKLAAYFACSFDYLFGLTDEYKAEQYTTVCSPNERFRDFLKENNYTRYQVHKATGLEEKRLSDWFHNHRTPSLASLYTIAKNYTCSLDYLAGRSKI